MHHRRPRRAAILRGLSLSRRNTWVIDRMGACLGDYLLDAGSRGILRSCDLGVESGPGGIGHRSYLISRITSAVASRHLREPRLW